MLQGAPDLSQTIARLRAKSQAEPKGFDKHIDSAARKLSELPGDFIFIGASPIRIGLQLMRIDGDRTCTFVPFSGHWMNRNNVYRTKDVPFRRNKGISIREAYRNAVLTDYDAEDLAYGTIKLNLVDCTNRGEGLLSFADLLVSSAETRRQSRLIAKRLQLVSIMCKNDSFARISSAQWDSQHGRTCVSGRTIRVPNKSWQILVSQKGRHYRCDDPRLTEPFPVNTCNSPPQPAPASNITAFHRAAQGIDPARLKAAFGLQLP